MISLLKVISMHFVCVAST